MKNLLSIFGVVLFYFIINTSVFGNNLEGLKKAYFAGGCFWGVEYHFEKLDGVKSVESGFMGGTLDNPSYKDVVRGKSGHLEVVEIVYDPRKVSYETLAKLFFEVHDSTQVDGQGPDIGEQYLSAVFISETNETIIVEKLIEILKSKGINAETTLRKAGKFYKADEHHQDYYEKNNKKPYCHSYQMIF